jgi:hypothetical protein
LKCFWEVETKYVSQICVRTSSQQTRIILHNFAHLLIIKRVSKHLFSIVKCASLRALPACEAAEHCSDALPKTLTWPTPSSQTIPYTLPPPPLWSQHPGNRTASARPPRRPQKTSRMAGMWPGIGTTSELAELPPKRVCRALWRAAPRHHRANRSSRRVLTIFRRCLRGRRRTAARRSLPGRQTVADPAQSAAGPPVAPSAGVSFVLHDKGRTGDGGSCPGVSRRGRIGGVYRGPARQMRGAAGRWDNASVTEYRKVSGGTFGGTTFRQSFKIKMLYNQNGGCGGSCRAGHGAGSGG